MKLTNILEARYRGPEQPKVSFRTIHRIVKKAAEDNNWWIWDKRTDKRRKDRRISYWGGRIPNKTKIKNQVIRELTRGNLPGRVYWHKAIGFHGPYDKLVIDNLPFETYEQGKEDHIHKLKKELKHLRSQGPHQQNSLEYNRIEKINQEIKQVRQKD